MTAPALSAILQPGAPVRHRGVAVTPLFPRVDPRAAYVTLDEALAEGLLVTEVDEGGRVPELTVANRTGRDVLLYDGEELLGAKQNRILDVTVLVPAGAVTTVPVSCVEQGRWRAVSPAFRAAPHAAHPELRRRKATRLAAAGGGPGTAQGEVWAAVADKAARLGAASPTGAAADLFRDRAPDVDALAARFPLQPGQSGAVLALAGRVVCLDAVSRPAAFARLYPKLLRGYVLDALEALDDVEEEGGGADASSVLAALDAASPTRTPSVCRGEQLTWRAPGLLAGALVLGDEILQVSAHAE